ncbi:hypothetical protein GsuE55_34180 [Geobacillus subterraneus]|uniref:Uncharacterized protein n=1 Tax=Geobacillus subterraneus TaxID=129338 RepID=A0A679FV78_9BACL|nr:hypothetical protein GsuE55_34180 [Geobacillus subterraneus]
MKGRRCWRRIRLWESAFTCCDGASVKNGFLAVWTDEENETPKQDKIFIAADKGASRKSYAMSSSPDKIFIAADKEQVLKETNHEYLGAKGVNMRDEKMVRFVAGERAASVCGRSADVGVLR